MPSESADAWIRSAKIVRKQSPEHRAAILADINPSKDWRKSFTNMLEVLLEKRKKNETVSALEIAELYLALGNAEKSLEWLSVAHDERSPRFIEIGVDPWWDPLRQNPKFKHLLHRLNLTDIKLPAPS